MTPLLKDSEYDIDSQYEDSILPIHHAHKQDLDPLIPIDTHLELEPKTASNTTWAITIFVFFAVFLLIATFKQWRRALLRLLLRCGDNVPIHRSTNSQYQRLAEYNQTYSTRRETLI